MGPLVEINAMREQLIKNKKKIYSHLKNGSDVLTIKRDELAFRQHHQQMSNSFSGD